MSILAESQKERDKIGELLDKDLPSYRRAYSDRTAWLMACLSELAYIRFNPVFSGADRKNYFLENIKSMVDGDRVAKLVKLIDAVGYDHEAETEKLKNELSLLRLELVKTFDRNGTQAILVKCGGEYAVLAFRGTEATSIRDIKSDCKAVLTTCGSGGKIHAGFNEAYNAVAPEIENELREGKCSGMPLFITGHSLGGALATVAAKKLPYNKIAACYTFGAPRPGNENWVSEMKTPVYRIVNAADCVTMVPPTGALIAILARAINFISPALEKWIVSRFGGYAHGGNMRYLTNCAQGAYNDVRLLYSVDFLRRMLGFVNQGLPWKKFVADHSISIYRKKMAVIAHRRN